MRFSSPNAVLLGLFALLVGLGLGCTDKSLDSVRDPANALHDASSEATPDGSPERDAGRDAGPTHFPTDAGPDVDASDSATADANVATDAAVDAATDAGGDSGQPGCVLPVDECGVCGGTGKRSVYADHDQDGLGDPNETELACPPELPVGYVDNRLDNLPACKSNVVDDCDVCDGPGRVKAFEDWDRDGLGDPALEWNVCPGTPGYVSNADDPEPLCATNDTDECGVCHGIGKWTYYQDADGDGLGDSNVSVVSCTQPDGYVFDDSDEDLECPDIKKVMVLYPIREASVSSLQREPGYGTNLPTWSAESHLVGDAREVVRSYMDFDYSDIPSDAFGLMADFALYGPPPASLGQGVPTASEGNNAWLLGRVTEAWDEGSLSWDHQPKVENSGAFPATAHDDAWSMGIGIQWNVYLALRYPKDNHGLMLGLADETQDGALRLASSKHPLAAVRPVLTVDYRDGESDACEVCGGLGRKLLHPDVDGDGLGDRSSHRYFCADEDSTGWVQNTKDREPTCQTNDTDECGVCGGKGRAWWYLDADHDGRGDAANKVWACTPPANYVALDGDAFPGCGTDDPDACGVCAGPGQMDQYEDRDGDGLGVPGVKFHGCPASGYAENPDDPEPDCATNDTDECGVCGGPGLVTWYEDRDGDGMGDAATSVIACTAPPGWVARGDDPDLDCRTIPGDLTVSTLEQAAALADVCEVLGSLSVASGLTSLTLPALRFVHYLNLQESPDLEHLSLPALTSADTVRFYDVPKLLTIELGKLTEISADLWLIPHSVGALDIRFAALVSVGGMVNVFLADGATVSTDEMFPALRHAKQMWVSGGQYSRFSSFGFPALESVDDLLYLMYGLTEEDGREGHVYLPRLKQVRKFTCVWGRFLDAPLLESANELYLGGMYLQRVELPGLREAQSLHFDSRFVLGISLPSLEQLNVLDSMVLFSEFEAPRLRSLGRGRFAMTQQAPLELAALETVAGPLAINAETVRLDALTSVGGTLELGHASGTTSDQGDTMLSWSSTALEHIAGALVVRNTGLSQLELPSLSSVTKAQKSSSGIDPETSVAISNNAALTHLTLPSLQTAPGSLDIHDNSVLAPCDVFTLETQLGKPASGDATGCQ